MNIEIDSNSGFCFGVVYAIEKAEKFLKKNENLICLGDIVHNDAEVKRLQSKGLKVVDNQQLNHLTNKTVMFRAHGEAPSSYKLALEKNLKVIDASCPIVLRLQISIKNKYEQIKEQGGQIVIFGKKGHAEVIGLAGQTENNAIIVSDESDIEKIDFTKPIAVFSQTTKSKDSYHKIIAKIKEKLQTDDFYFQDSVCKQVANRDKDLRVFCQDKDVIIFMSGKKSSNGKMLFEICKKINPNTKFISEIDELQQDWFSNVSKVGITGATSTPAWLMLDAKKYIEENFC